MVAGGIKRKLSSDGGNTCSKGKLGLGGHRCGEQRRRDTWRGRDNSNPPIYAHNVDRPICHRDFGSSDLSLPDPTIW
ncbi:hypothetical protein AHAS_Ahas12G0064500 [Arachis hypogaea]